MGIYKIKKMLLGYSVVGDILVKIREKRGEVAAYEELTQLSHEVDEAINKSIDNLLERVNPYEED